MFIFRRLALGFGLLCGLLSSQLPEFAQQYRQRLGGAIDELTAVVDQFRSEATAAGMDSAKAVAQLRANGDELARQRGQAIEQTIERRDRLAESKQRYLSAGPVGRLVVFAEYFDTKIASRAWSDYEPAVPTTPEGFVTAGAGAVAGYGLLHLLRLPFRRRRRRPAAA